MKTDKIYKNVKKLVFGVDMRILYIRPFLLDISFGFRFQALVFTREPAYKKMISFASMSVNEFHLMKQNSVQKIIVKNTHT